MSYKKAPSIKHQEFRKQKAIAKLQNHGRIAEFINSMSPGARNLFEKALEEQVKEHQAKKSN